MLSAARATARHLVELQPDLLVLTIIDYKGCNSELLEPWGFYSGPSQVLINVGLEETATLKNISGLERLFLAWFLGE